MDKRTEQVNVKMTPEMKRQVLEFCAQHDMHESTFGEMAFETFFTYWNSFGPAHMMDYLIKALKK